ncbi:Obp56h.2 family protein [Megaselia abdita]
MKLFISIVLLALTASALADGAPPFGPCPEFMECMKSNGLEKEDGKEIFKKLQAGEELDAEVQKKVGCTAKCAMEKKGIWKDGGIDSEALEAKMSEFKMLDTIPNAKENIKECAAVKGTDDCDTVFQIMKCMKEKFPFPPPTA